MRLDDKTLADKLESMPAPEPPPELLERLKNDIPDPVVVHGGGESPETGRPSSGRPWIRLAASLALLIGAGLFAYWMVDYAPPLEETVDTEERRDPRRAFESIGRSAGDVSSAEEPEPLREPTEDRVERLDTKGADSRRATSKTEESGVVDVEPLPLEEVITVTPESPSGDEGVAVDGVSVREKEAMASSPGYHDFDRLEEKERAGRDSTSPGTTARLRSLGYVTAQAEPMPEPAPQPAPPPAIMPPSTGGTTEPNDQSYGDVFFRSYGVNPFVDTEDDALSTFGFDVDTGSYGVVRRYLRDGNLPPASAVRVEEIVNAFDYGDRAPRRGTFALTAEGAPSPWPPGKRYYLLRLAARGREVARAEQRPVDLVFVIDTSGSMNYENRLALVKRALRLLLDRLGPDDRVALVTYGSRGEVRLPFTRDEETIRRAVERLHPGGSTNAEEGLGLAYDLAVRQGRRNAVRRILLCSDGVANVGRTGPDSILERIGEAARSGVELTTVGFGMGNYNDVLMEQLADRGNGRYAYVDTLAEARRLFVEELTGTLYSIAAEARAQVEFDPEIVSRYRLLGYENRDIADERFRDDTVDAAEIGSGHTVTALYEIKLREGVDPRREERSFGVFRVRYRPIESKRFEEEELLLDLGMLEPSWQAASRAFNLSAVAARFAEILRGSYWARDGDLHELARRAEAVAEDWSGDERVEELVELIRRAGDLGPAEDRTPGRDDE